MRTPEEKLLDPRPGSKVAAARDFGIDLSLTASMLRLTPQQRIDHLQAAMKDLAELARSRAAGPQKKLK
jgi:hypothetical protein